MTSVWRDRLIMVAPFLGVIFLALVTPSEDGPTICPFALCTGTACPGCGMTRAAASLIRGDVSAAMSYHPLVPVVTMQILAGWVWFALRRSGRVPPMSARTLNATLIGTLVALLAVWVARLVTGTLPAV
jgi:hypothetical protein